MDTPAPKIKAHLTRSFGEEFRFLKAWARSPSNVGSILPTSGVTASRMASIVRPESGLPVLELGPGTGVITRAILARGIEAKQLHAVEFSAEFSRWLRAEFPGLRVFEGDAFDLDKTLGDVAETTFDCVVSSMPLLNFPKAKRQALIDDLLDRIPRGRPVIQFSYGPLSPVLPTAQIVVEHFDFILRNIPPAQLWTYKRP